mgnify:CR=1 FL=1
MFFKNEMLRGAGENVEMTEEQVKEYLECKKSIFHFAKYFTIIGPAGEEKMKLRDYQEKIVPRFLYELKTEFSDIYNRFINEYPEYEKIEPNFIGRHAYIYSLRDGVWKTLWTYVGQ